ncbi:MAG: Nif3-like dinuclear metal center hexameric protein [Armatimonadia bacterium]
MTIVADLVHAVEELAPPSLAEDWDNVGLQVGASADPVTGVMLAVDATSEVVAQAQVAGCSAVLAHHPLIFRPLTTLASGNPPLDAAVELIRANMALYVAHTNLDKATTVGTPLALARAVGLQDAPGAPEDEPAAPAALWRRGYLPEPVALGSFAQDVATRLGADVRVIGDLGRMVRRIAVVPGAGGDMVGTVAEASAEVLLTGELKHHEALEARGRGLAVIAAGHLATERPVLAVLKQQLEKMLPGLRICIAEEKPLETVVSGRQ